MVSSAGFNALLKLVEEPPEFVKFVFATTEPDEGAADDPVRTHHYPFRLIPPSVLRPYLEQLCAAEGVQVEPAVFPLVVRAGGGSVRDTLSVLDQLIAGAGPEGVTYTRAAALLGVTDAALLDELCDALVAGDGAAVYATIDRVAEAGHDPRRFAADLLERLRDLMVLQQVPDAAAKGLLNAPADQLDRMAGHASQLGAATLSRYADIVHDGLVEMRGTTSPRLLLELICARMLLPGAEDSQRALLQRLEQLERRLGAVSAAPAAGTPAPPAPAPTPSAPPPAAVTRPRPLRRLLRHRLPPARRLGSGASAASAPAPITPAATSPPRPPRRAPGRGRTAPGLGRDRGHGGATQQTHRGGPRRPSRRGRQHHRAALPARYTPPCSWPPQTAAGGVPTSSAASGRCVQIRERQVRGDWPGSPPAGDGSAAPPATTGGTGSAAAPTAAARSRTGRSRPDGGASAGRRPIRRPPHRRLHRPAADPATGGPPPPAAPAGGERHRPRPLGARLPAASSTLPGGCSVTNSAPAAPATTRAEKIDCPRKLVRWVLPAPDPTGLDQQQGDDMTPGGQPDLQQLMRQAQQMQEQLMAAQAELAETEVTGTAGGGMVTATLTGDGRSSIKIDPGGGPDDVETLEDLVVAALRPRRAAQPHHAEDGPVDRRPAGDAGLPGMPGPR